MNKNYENLANAIIEQAVKDYRKATCILAKYPHNSYARGERADLLSFFRSGWFGLLTGLDPEVLISQLDKEVLV